jgi:hypothetical protein
LDGSSNKMYVHYARLMCYEYDYISIKIYKSVKKIYVTFSLILIIRSTVLVCFAFIVSFFHSRLFVLINGSNPIRIILILIILIVIILIIGIIVGFDFA